MDNNCPSLLRENNINMAGKRGRGGGGELLKMELS
jgi:hypothetical protein